MSKSKCENQGYSKLMILFTDNHEYESYIVTHEVLNEFYKKARSYTSASSPFVFLDYYYVYSDANDHRILRGQAMEVINLNYIVRAKSRSVKI
jgi:hypothetical protein